MVDVASSNPLMAGLPLDLVPQPSTFVILGAAGDLARRKLLPALYNLALDGLLPVSFAVLGVALLFFVYVGAREILQLLSRA